MVSEFFFFHKILNGLAPSCCQSYINHRALNLIIKPDHLVKANINQFLPELKPLRQQSIRIALRNGTIHVGCVGF